MSVTHGSIWWNELMTRDVKAARAYYQRVCGWRFESFDMATGGDYLVAKLGEQPVAGMLDIVAAGQPDEVASQWFTYIAVDDLDAAVEQTKAAGGAVTRAPFDVPGVGRIAIVQDPGGAAVGIMTPADPF